MKHPKYKSGSYLHSRAYSLIELMVAVGVSGTILYTANSFMTRMNKTREYQSNLHNANQLARNFLLTIKHAAKKRLEPEVIDPDANQYTAEGNGSLMSIDDAGNAGAHRFLNSRYVTTDGNKDIFIISNECIPRPNVLPNMAQTPTPMDLNSIA